MIALTEAAQISQRKPMIQGTAMGIRTSPKTVMITRAPLALSPVR